MKDLNELLEHNIKELYAAEKQLLEVLPEVIEVANHKKVISRLRKLLKASETHFARIQKICEKLEINPGSTKWNGRID